MVTAKHLVILFSIVSLTLVVSADLEGPNVCQKEEE